MLSLRVPSTSVIFGRKYGKVAIHGIPDEHSATKVISRRRLVVLKLDGVPEAFGDQVGEEEGPGGAGVGGFVEAGEVSFARGHDDGGLGVEGLDAAEVEFSASGGVGQRVQ